MARKRSNHAFTLLELILVMVIITTALAVAAPSLGGWGRGAKLRDMGDQFLAVTRWARSQAIADAQVYRLNIDPAAGTYWLTMQDGEKFVELGNSFGQVYSVPAGYRIAMVNDAGSTAMPQSTAQSIDFQPSGRLTPARVRIVTDLGAVLEISAATSTEQFSAAPPQEVRR